MQTSIAKQAAVARPRAAVRPSGVGSRVRQNLLVVRAEPAVADKKSPVETAIDSARDTCESGSAGECAAAWDEVEELSASAADKKQAKGQSDPLDQYCDDNPEADECRVYED